MQFTRRAGTVYAVMTEQECRINPFVADGPNGTKTIDVLHNDVRKTIPVMIVGQNTTFHHEDVMFEMKEKAEWSHLPIPIDNAGLNIGL